MLKFLFWNVCGPASAKERRNDRIRPLGPPDSRYIRLRRLLRIVAERNAVDVIILAESPFEGRLGLPGFAEVKTSIKPNRATRCRLEIYHRNTVLLSPENVLDRGVLFKFRRPQGSEQFVLATIHLDSSRSRKEYERQMKVRELTLAIADMEKQTGINRTLIVGDFNFDPFDHCFIAPDHLNAVPSKILVRYMERKSQPSSPGSFYNPMWVHLTDHKRTPPGTYFYSSGELTCRYWYLFDQVLLRPALLEFWEDESLNILTEIGKRSLLTAKGIPDVERYSDHLPLIFALNLP